MSELISGVEVEVWIGEEVSVIPEGLEEGHVQYMTFLESAVVDGEQQFKLEFLLKGEEDVTYTVLAKRCGKVLEALVFTVEEPVVEVEEEPVVEVEE